MNDRDALSALLQSPGFLLQELGVHEVCLYRWRSREWQWLSIAQLDEEIWQSGEALVFRQMNDGNAAIIRFGCCLSVSLPWHQESSYTLVTIRPNYAGNGRNFLVSLRDKEAGELSYWPVEVMKRLKRLSFDPTDMVLPW